MIVFLVILLLPANCLNKTHHWTTCDVRDTLICKCTSDDFNDVKARCNFNHVTDLNSIINSRQDVIRLNLSGNQIQEIPQNSFHHYSNLVYLSLSSNNIHTISQGAFSGMKRLRELNLQDNMIHHWDTMLIHQDLPNLIMLNIAQNMYWKPDQQILSLPNLKVIFLLAEFDRGNGWVCTFFRCYLIRKNATIQDANYTFAEKLSRNIQEKVHPNYFLSRHHPCWLHKMVFRNTSYWDVIDKSRYYWHCEYITSVPRCMLENRPINTHMRYYSVEITIQKYCWKLTQKIHIITLVEGICATVFNLIVIITTLRSRVLRESVANVLVANIAVGDFLFSIYVVTITMTRQIMEGNEFLYFHLPHYCRIVGLFLLIGQFSSPLMLFIMTLERYLAVVYCMRPHIRLTRRMSYAAVMTMWCLSASLAVSFMTSLKISRETDLMCVPRRGIDGVLALEYTGGIGVVLYILSIALYVHMYLDFRKTNQKTVQLQRENRLARRIALIMFTNVFFYIFPLLALMIAFNIFNYINVLGGKIFSETFAITCLGINSCLNPILFSFRNELFRNEFKKRFFLCRGSVSAQP